MILNSDQSFLFCGQKLSGISDLTFSSDFSLQNFQTLGRNRFGFQKNGPSVGKVDFSRSLIYADPVLSYTGEMACSGVFSYGTVNYGFESGYLESYSVSASVGQVPSVSASVSVFGEMKSGAANQLETSHPSVFVPSPRSILISNEYVSSNLVSSFQWGIECPRRARYSVGNSLFPSFVESLGPTVNASITYNVKGFSAIDLNNFARNVSSPNFSVTIKNRDLSQTLMTLPVYNAQVLSQELQGTVDSPLSLTLTYGGYID